MKNFDVRGKAALVTGGNGGIGLGMARGLAQAGAAIAVAGRDEKKNSAAVRELKSLGVQALGLFVDVLEESSCKNMVSQAAEKLGRLDILVNNAGMNIRKPPQELSLEDWKRVMDTNLTSAFVASQAAYPHLKRAGAGKIINTGSMMSIFAAAYLAPYSASKAGNLLARGSRSWFAASAAYRPTTSATVIWWSSSATRSTASPAATSPSRSTAR